MEPVLLGQPEARAAEERCAGADGERGLTLHHGFGPERERRRGFLQHHRVSQVQQ